MSNPSAKGQIIPEGNCGALNFPKKPYLKISAIVPKMGQIKIKALYYIKSQINMIVFFGFFLGSDTFQRLGQISLKEFCSCIFGKYDTPQFPSEII